MPSNPRIPGLLIKLGSAAIFWPVLFAAPPNIVLITVDTLRADHLHCYGYQHVRTPNIDRLAAEGTRFATVITAAPLTLPSHCSIMTGAYPMFHGVRDNVGYRLDPSMETLAQILKRNGYATGAFVGAYVLDRTFGLGTGFSSYYDNFEAQSDPRETINLAQLKRRGKEVVDHALAWLREPRSGPFFVWVHLYDAHDPYDPPPPFKAEYAARPYDGEIAYVDQQVGRLLAFLNGQGLYTKTIVTLTSDHGESLGEHKELRHGYFIYDATLRVPWIVKPAMTVAKPGVVNQQVRSIDIAPTILQLAGYRQGKMMQGAGLAGLMSGQERETVPGAYGESFYPQQFGWSALRCLRVGNLKFIDAPRPELYDLDKDPVELNNRAADRPAVVAELRARLKALDAASSATELQARAARSMTPDELEKLARLGYVGNPTQLKKPNPDAAALPDPKDQIDLFYLINRAGVDAGNGKCDRAEPALLQVIEKSPNIAAAYVMLGRCYFIQERYPDAMKIFEQLRGLDSQSQDAQFYIAACQFHLDQLDQAEEGLRKVLAVNPKRTFAHKYLGFVYQAEGKLDLSIQEFQSVLETSPGDLEAHGKLGFLLANASRLKEALPHFQKVVALIPTDGSAHFNLGLAYEGLGENVKANSEKATACQLDAAFCKR